MRREVTRGGMFLYVNRRRHAIKLIKWDHDGLAIYHKRLERGVFETPKRSSDGEGLSISGDQIDYLL
jgi:transposase